MIARRIVLLVAVLALGAAAVGCGSDSEGSDNEGSDGATTVATSSNSKAEFVKEANKICDEGKAEMVGELLAFYEQNPKLSKGELEAQTVETVLQPGVQKQAEEIRSVGAPEADVEEIEAFLTTLLRGAEEAGGKKTTNNKEIQSKLRPAGDMARAYGIDDCDYGY